MIVLDCHAIGPKGLVFNERTDTERIAKTLFRVLRTMQGRIFRIWWILGAIWNWIIINFKQFLWVLEKYLTRYLVIVVQS